MRRTIATMLLAAVLIGAAVWLAAWGSASFFRPRSVALVGVALALVAVGAAFFRRHVAVDAVWVALLPLSVAIYRLPERFVDLLSESRSTGLWPQRAYVPEYRIDALVRVGLWRAPGVTAVTWAIVAALVAGLACRILGRWRLDRAGQAIGLSMTGLVGVLLVAAWLRQPAFHSAKAYAASLPTVPSAAYVMEAESQDVALKNRRVVMGDAVSPWSMQDLESVRHDARLGVDLAVGRSGVLVVARPGAPRPALPIGYIPTAYFVSALLGALGAAAILARTFRARVRRELGGGPYRAADAPTDVLRSSGGFAALAIATLSVMPLLRVVIAGLR